MPLNVPLIQSVRPQNLLHYFPTIGSTMTEGARLAQQGEPHGTVVVAEEQVAGIGRQGRQWHSPQEVGLYSSTLLRLPLAPANLPVASLLLGLAVAQAIQRCISVPCDLRWPNDVLIGESKVAGILPHLVSGCIVAGVGINVNNMSFEEGLRTPATSLALASGAPVSREELLINLLEAFDSQCDLLAVEGPCGVIRAFSNVSSYVRHRRVMIEESGLRGITTGLDDNGFLLLQTEAGVTERISSGGVRPVV